MSSASPTFRFLITLAPSVVLDGLFCADLSDADDELEAAEEEGVFIFALVVVFWLGVRSSRALEARRDELELILGVEAAKLRRVDVKTAGRGLGFEASLNLAMATVSSVSCVFMKDDV